MAANSKEEPSAAEVEAARKGAASKILFSFFWSIFGSCIVLQSDAQLFTAACGGDPGATARAFGAVSGATGIISLFVNQAGGKLSDSTGRRPLFLLGPIVTILCNLAVFRFSTNLKVLMATKTLRLVFNTFSGSTMSTAALMDISTPREMAQLGAKLGTAAGVAVVLAPVLYFHALFFS